VDDELTGDVMDVDMGADDADAALDREEPEERRDIGGLSDPVLMRRFGSAMPNEARLSRREVCEVPGSTKS
jgi:hypothetical protein